jgi:hypothetical protein
MISSVDLLGEALTRGRRSDEGCSYVVCDAKRAWTPSRCRRSTDSATTAVLGSERLTGATLDRLTHRCRIISTKGSQNLF